MIAKARYEKPLEVMFIVFTFGAWISLFLNWGTALGGAKEFSSHFSQYVTHTSVTWAFLSKPSVDLENGCGRTRE